VARGEAERLNALRLGDSPDLKLLETRVERLPTAVRITHVFQHRPTGARLLTEPFTGYD
jgi:hypothetical protein